MRLEITVGPTTSCTHRKNHLHLHVIVQPVSSREWLTVVRALEGPNMIHVWLEFTDCTSVFLTGGRILTTRL